MTTRQYDVRRLIAYRLESSRAHRILWLLEEVQIPYELKTYRRQQSKLADPKLKEVHPLGKSPLLVIESPATSQPLVLAESGAIVEYISDHFGRWLIPKRYREGKEDQIGGETESWLRHRMLMHYAEGSFMPLNLIELLLQSLWPRFSFADIADAVVRHQERPCPFLHPAHNEQHRNQD